MNLDLDVIRSRLQAYAGANAGREVQRAADVIRVLFPGQVEQERQCQSALETAEIMIGLCAPEPYVAASMIILDETSSSRVKLREAVEPQTADLMSQVSHCRAAFTNVLANKRLGGLGLHRLDSINSDFGVWTIYLAQRLQRLRHQIAVGESAEETELEEVRLLAVPLAERLGLRLFRIELEDLLLQTRKPTRLREIDDLIEQWKKEPPVQETRIALVEGIAAQGIQADVLLRPRGRASIHQMLENQPDLVNRPQKLFKFLIVVASEKNCYAVKSAIECFAKIKRDELSGKEPLTDFIQKPSANGYRGLHVNTDLGSGITIAVRVYTQAMLTVADHGLAANWRGVEVRLQQGVTAAPPDHILVFTRGGDPLYLPKGATALDFAYHIHSEIGDHTSGIRINGKDVRPAQQLRNGDYVEVIVSKHINPSLTWLEFVRTDLTKKLIRRWLYSNLRQDVITRGRILLDRGLARIPQTLSSEEILSAVKKMEPASRYRTMNDFLTRVGAGEVNLDDVVLSLAKQVGHGQIIVKSDRQLPVLLAQCCHPEPGDSIIGVVVRDRIAIHQRSCRNKRGDADLVECEWAENIEYTQEVSISVESGDRVGLLLDILKPIAEMKVDLSSVVASSLKNKQAHVLLRATLTDKAQLPLMLQRILNVRSVQKAFPVEESKIEAEIKPMNPYYINLPVQRQKVFFGREHELTLTLQELRTPGANSGILVWGQKRIGKSSFLYFLQRQTANEQLICCYNSMQANANGDDAEFLYMLAQNICKALRREGERITSPSIEEYETHALAHFGRFFDEIETILVGRRLVLMLDEFQILLQNLQDGRLKPETILFLRDLVQRGAGTNFVFAYTGSLVRFASQPIPSQLFDIFHPIKLSYLAADDARALVTVPAQDHLEFEADAVEYLLKVTNGNPWCLQNLCFELFSRKSGRGQVTLSDAQNLVTTWCTQWTGVCADYFASVPDLAGRLVLAAIAEKDGMPAELSELDDQLRPYVSSESMIQKAVEELEDLSFVTIAGSTATLAVPLLSQALHRRMPVKRVRLEFRD